MRRLVPLLALSAVVLSTAAAYADVGDQLFKLLADNDELNDRFGRSVAISGTTAIVAAHYDDDNGSDSGSAYLFDTTTGQQIHKLLPHDGQPGQQFGYSVGIDGTTAIVGALYDDGNGYLSGAAYLFDTTTGQQIFKLLATDGAEGDAFGLSVAISGTTAIVGAYANDDCGSNSGSAYLFDTTTGEQIAKILPDDGKADDRFGISVAINGTLAIVGAQAGSNEDGIRSGCAYLFDTTKGEQIQQIGKLLPDDGEWGDAFSCSVALISTTAIVGAPSDDDYGNRSGSAYLFDTSTGKQITKLVPDDTAAEDWFGNSVAINAEFAIVGAFANDDNGSTSGSAYFFDSTTGEQIAKILPDDGAEGDAFGISVAASATIAIVGATHGGNNLSGAAYLFAASACPADFDDDGDIDAADLAILLGNWGPCPGCPADFNGDDAVGAADLAVLLGSWGPCL